MQTANTPTIPAKFIDQVLGDHAALSLGAIRADVEGAEAYDDDQVYIDYTNNLPAVLDMLAIALSKLQTIRTSATQGVPNCVNLDAIDRILSAR